MSMGKTDQKAICIYCDTWAQGGIETFVAETLLHMDTDGLFFKLVCAEKQDSRFDSRLEERGFSMYPLQKAENVSVLRKILKTTIPLAKLCKQERIEVVHLNVFHGISLIQALFLKVYGIRHVIVHCHGSGFRENNSKTIKLLGHWICKQLLFFTADERWAASEQAAQFLFGNKVARIIPNGIETKRFRFVSEKRFELRKKLRVGDRRLLGCVGRLDTQKNQRFLLPLLAEMKRRGDNVMLLLIGDGEERGTLERLSQELSIEEDVVFLGNSTHVSDWMCAMDALLIPSISEGLSIAAIEGQASGLPVFCSMGVPREAALSETIRFLPLSDGAQWVKAIEAIPEYNRVFVNEQIQNSMYNIQRSAALVRELYQKA